MSSVPAGLQQFRIVRQRLLEVPRDHAISTLQAIVGLHPINRIAEHADHPCFWSYLRDSFSGFIRGEIGGCDLPYLPVITGDRKSTRLNSSHSQISYAVFCLKKKKR